MSTDGQTSERSERRRPRQTAGLLSRSHRGSYRPSGRCAIGRPGGARGRHREPEERRATGGVAAVLSKMSWAQFITSLWWVGRQTAPKFPHGSLRLGWATRDRTRPSYAAPLCFRSNEGVAETALVASLQVLLVLWRASPVCRSTRDRAAATGMGGPPTRQDTIMARSFGWVIVSFGDGMREVFLVATWSDDASTPKVNGMSA